MTKTLRVQRSGNAVRFAICEDGIGEGKDELDDVILRVVDETMKAIFQEAGANAIYDYMEKKCQLKREEIGKKPKIFSTGLERLLGTAAPVIENLILKNLYHELRLEYEAKDNCGLSIHMMKLRK